jgi:CTP:molybdopterin cytidylyltransferase MocA
MGRPKATTELAGRRFVDLVVATLQAAALSPILVVHGADRFDMPAGVIPVHNAGWRQGPLSSLQCALRRLSRMEQSTRHTGSTGVLVATVDRPRVDPETIRSLLAAHAELAPGPWQPRFEGRSGHPIVWPADLLPDLLSLDAEDQRVSARTLLARPDVTSRRRFVDVEDPAIHENFDRPSDLPAAARNEP